MRPIAENTYQLEDSTGSNGYVVRGNGRAAVIDPGMSSGYAKILAELREAETKIGQVTDILLTHYDADHAQVVKRLQETLRVPVWLGAADAAILRGEVPPPTRLRRVIGRLAPTAYPDDVSELSGEHTIFDGLTAFPTPGHTPGHMAYQWSGILFSGDSVIVPKRGSIRKFYGPINSDNAQAAKTAELLRSRVDAGSVSWICAGHNSPKRVETGTPRS